MKSMKLLDQVIKGIKPVKAVDSEIKRIVEKINSVIQKQGIKAGCILGGSVAKGTFLKDEHDVDLFVRFDYSYKDKDISKILGSVLEKISKKVELVHGSRDYYNLKKGLFSYEVVPVLDIKDPKKAVNVTDMSPLHVVWVKGFEKKNYGDNIRLAKAFCKAQHVYGAESYIKGFSGHVLDILVIYYKGFLNLLKASQAWNKEITKTGKKVVDFYNVYKGKALKKMNISKIQSPLIVIDPVLPERNAAAALGNERFEIFVKKADEFLKKPSKAFFKRKEINKEYFKKLAGKSKNNRLILLDAKPLKGKEDIVGAKLLKVFQYIKKQLTFNDFIVKEGTGWHFDVDNSKALMGFVVDKKPLEKTRIHTGPPLNSKKNAAAFKAKYKKTFVKNNRLYTEIKRPYTTPEQLIKDLIKNAYIKEKIKNIK